MCTYIRREENFTNTQRYESRVFKQLSRNEAERQRRGGNTVLTLVGRNTF